MAFLRTWSQYSFWNVLLWQGLLRMISPGSGMRGLKWKCRHIPQRERGVSTLAPGGLRTKPLAEKKGGCCLFEKPS